MAVAAATAACVAAGRDDNAAAAGGLLGRGAAVGWADEATDGWVAGAIAAGRPVLAKCLLVCMCDCIRNNAPVTPG